MFYTTDWRRSFNVQTDQSWSWVGSIHRLGWVGSEFFNFWWVELGWVGWRLDCVIFLTSWNTLLSANEYCRLQLNNNFHWLWTCLWRVTVVVYSFRYNLICHIGLPGVDDRLGWVGWRLLWVGWGRWKCGIGKCRSDKVWKAVRIEKSKIPEVYAIKRNELMNSDLMYTSRQWRTHGEYTCSFAVHAAHAQGSH